MTSADGTVIAYERSGVGPALVLVDGALCSRDFGPTWTLAARLATRFTVHQYDRRGRGDSGGGTGPYHPDREIEDLAAVIAVAGGTAIVVMPMGSPTAAGPSPTSPITATTCRPRSPRQAR